MSGHCRAKDEKLKRQIQISLKNDRTTRSTSEVGARSPWDAANPGRTDVVDTNRLRRRSFCSPGLNGLDSLRDFARRAKPKPPRNADLSRPHIDNRRRTASGYLTIRYLDDTR